MATKDFHIAVTNNEFANGAKLGLRTKQVVDGPLVVNQIQEITALRVCIEGCSIIGDGFQLVQHEDGSVDLTIRNAVIKST